MKHAILFFILAIFSGTGLSSEYSNTPATGSKGNWNWSEHVAYQHFSNGTDVVVTFSPDYECDLALFGILSNDEINSIGLNIDGNRYRNVSPDNLAQQDNRVFAVFPLTDSTLKELKKGTYLRIDIGRGEISSKLAGSAKSFNMAYGNCMKAIEKTKSKSSWTAPPGNNITDYNQESWRILTPENNTTGYSREEKARIKTKRHDDRINTNAPGKYVKNDKEKIMEYFYWESIGMYCVFFSFIFFQWRHLKYFEGASQVFLQLLTWAVFLGMTILVAYLIYYGFITIWWAPLVIFFIGLIVNTFIGGMLLGMMGLHSLSLLGFMVWPVCAYYMFTLLPSTTCNQINYSL